LSEGLYNKYKLKRVYYSAYIEVNNDKNLPTVSSPPLLRENRLYQADWLLRFYGFKSEELLNETHQNFNNLLDPKCDWALRNLDKFPIEINSADYFTLLKIPGIGVISAKRIIQARRTFNLNYDNLKKLGVVLKRARYFILCNGKYYDHVKYFKESFISENLISLEKRNYTLPINSIQMSLFDLLSPSKEDKVKCLTGNI
jgi:predicted DNA-binding helix-hairpin-helix protein